MKYNHSTIRKVKKITGLEALEEQIFCKYCRESITEIGQEKQQGFHTNCHEEYEFYAQNILKEMQVIEELGNLLGEEIPLITSRRQNFGYLVSENRIIKLRLKGKMLSDFPEIITELRYLNELNLIGNQLTTLPDSIRELQHLRVLFLSKNQFTTFPLIIRELKSLSSLYLISNQLTSIPNWITEINQLGILSLFNNQISDLTHFKYPRNLVILDLGGNPLSDSKARLYRGRIGREEFNQSPESTP